MAKRASKKYKAAFKNHWIKRYLEGGHTFLALSKEAGVSPDSLSDWVKAYQKAQAKAPEQVASTSKTPAAKPSPALPKPTKKSIAVKHRPHQETDLIAQLRKDLAAALQERDILKQALRIFCSYPTGS